MKAVIQRVSHASVSIDGKEKSRIGKGLLVLLGVAVDDDDSDVAWLVRKVSQMRIFNDAEGVMNCSVEDVQGDVLVVSQFTLLASTKKGNRPSWIGAAPHSISIPLYERFCHELSTSLGKPVLTGTFGADMQVELLNDGPVTIIIDTKNKV